MHVDIDVDVDISKDIDVNIDVDIDVDTNVDMDVERYMTASASWGSFKRGVGFLQRGWGRYKAGLELVLFRTTWLFP